MIDSEVVNPVDFSMVAVAEIEKELTEKIYSDTFTFMDLDQNHLEVCSGMYLTATCG